MRWQVLRQGVHTVCHALQRLLLGARVLRQCALQNGTARTDEQPAPRVGQAPLHQTRLQKHGRPARQRQHSARHQAQLQ
ncbi:MAG: hypothetical protein M1430_03935 [Betaproteobacteria bacterium]|nr:hypothetical protein [Betaproteobacteria bacterium]